MKIRVYVFVGFAAAVMLLGLQGLKASSAEAATSHKAAQYSIFKAMP